MKKIDLNLSALNMKWCENGTYIVTAQFKEKINFIYDENSRTNNTVKVRDTTKLKEFIKLKGIAITFTPNGFRIMRLKPNQSLINFADDA